MQQSTQKTSYLKTQLKFSITLTHKTFQKLNTKEKSTTTWKTHTYTQPTEFIT